MTTVIRALEAGAIAAAMIALAPAARAAEALPHSQRGDAHDRIACTCGQPHEPMHARHGAAEPATQAESKATPAQAQVAARATSDRDRAFLEHVWTAP